MVHGRWRRKHALTGQDWEAVVYGWERIDDTRKIFKIASGSYYACIATLQHPTRELCELQTYFSCPLHMCSKSAKNKTSWAICTNLQEVLSQSLDTKQVRRCEGDCNCEMYVIQQKLGDNWQEPIFKNNQCIHISHKTPNWCLAKFNTSLSPMTPRVIYHVVTENLIHWLQYHAWYSGKIGLGINSVKHGEKYLQGQDVE